MVISDEGDISMECWMDSRSDEGNSSGENEGTARSNQEESGEDKGKHCSVHFFVTKVLCYA